MEVGHCLAALLLLLSPIPSLSLNWTSWIKDFGHDSYRYPSWISSQMAACSCRVSYDRAPEPPLVRCFDAGSPEQEILMQMAENLGSFGGDGSDSSSTLEHVTKADDLETFAQANPFCFGKAWLLSRMPPFDRSYLPPSVSIEGTSMLDDNLAFYLMAERAAAFTEKVPKPLKLAYTLPYASYHEARVNWRPLFFSKFFALVAEANSTADAVARLVAPNHFTNVTGFSWPDKPGKNDGSMNYQVQWGSSTAPPIISPFDFISYGYGSCTAWATLLTYVLRSVGVPARQVGTPCWNSGEFAGLAADNANVTKCWHGSGNDGTSGGKWLNNHNWVEFWDTQTGNWEFVNVPPGTSVPNKGLCGDDFDPKTGCHYNKTTGCSAVTGGPGAASRDHEIFAVTWGSVADFDPKLHGGELVDVKDLKLSSGEEVSPLVWSPALHAPDGSLITRTGLRVVNRTEFYRCKDGRA